MAGVDHSLKDAVAVLQKMPSAKFDETVELSAHLGVDPKQSDQMVRGTVNLPHGSGKKIRVVVFTEKSEEAIEAGAMHAGLEDLIKKVEGGWTDFDVALATPSAMKQVRPVARVLGPRGLMPNPKSGTVTDDIPKGVQAVLAGRVEFKMDKTANLAIIVGKRSFTEEQLVENILKAIEALSEVRPESIKGSYVKRFNLSASMSPSIALEMKQFSIK